MFSKSTEEAGQKDDTAPEEVTPASYLYTLYTTQEKKWDFKEKKNTDISITALFIFKD